MTIDTTPEERSAFRIESIPSRVTVWCGEHPTPHQIVAYVDTRERRQLADGDWHRGEWAPAENGDGLSGRYDKHSVSHARLKVELVCAHHAPRNRKPVQFSDRGSESRVLDVIAHAGLSDVTLTEVRALRAALAALNKREEGFSLDHVRAFGRVLREGHGDSVVGVM